MEAFGLQMPGRVYVSGTPTREGFTGHELDPETGMNYAGARYYMPALGRFTSTDPHAASYPGSSPFSYALNNPISLVDPDGMDTKSTHTDRLGNILAVYDDGDTGVYRHDDVGDLASLNQKCSGNGTTGCGGDLMGQTETWDEFAERVGNTDEPVSLDPASHSYLPLAARIMFGQSWDPVFTSMNNQARGMNVVQIALNSTGGKGFDIKTTPRYGSQGRLIGDFYTSSRTAGNYLAGMNANTAGVSFDTFQRIAGGLHNGGRLGAALAAGGRQYGPAPAYGELPMQYRWSRRGYYGPLSPNR